MIIYMAEQGRYLSPAESLRHDATRMRSLYVNLTNRCPCSCTFCLRTMKDMRDDMTLWLQQEPSVEEVKEALDGAPWPVINEVVFCGFGEPTERLETVVMLLRHIREAYPAVKTRINTNGLSDLLYGRNTAKDFAGGLLDTISISLNEYSAERYLAVTRSRFGLDSYDAMLTFAEHCKAYIPQVVMTVVDQVESPAAIEKCRQICSQRGLTLRVRRYEGN